MRKVEFRKHRIKGLCAAKYCQNEVGKDGILCSTCRARVWRALNPVKYAFNNHKNRAKQRGIPWDLTYEEFYTWKRKVKFVKGAGRHADSWTVDRINDDPAKGYYGYRLDNIQKKKLKNNVRKFMLKYCYQSGKGWVEKSQREKHRIPKEDDYF